MSKINSEIAQAWEDVSFWQDLVVHLKTPEPGVRQAFEKAKLRYENAFHKCNQLNNQ